MVGRKKSAIIVAEKNITAINSRTSKHFVVKRIRGIDLPRVSIIFGRKYFSVARSDNIIPPSVLPCCSKIIIDHSIGGICIQNVPQTIPGYGMLDIKPGKTLTILDDASIINLQPSLLSNAKFCTTRCSIYLHY